MWLVTLSIGTGASVLGVVAAFTGDRPLWDRIAMAMFFLGIAVAAGAWLLAILFPRRCGSWGLTGIPIGLTTFGAALAAGGMGVLVHFDPDSGNLFTDGGLGAVIIGGVMALLGILVLLGLTAAAVEKHRGATAEPHSVGDERAPDDGQGRAR